MKLFQRSSTGKIKFLEIYTDGPKLIRERGIIGSDKIQKTSKICKKTNKGKANELSAKEQALEEMKSKITLKKKEGYSEKMPDEKSEAVEQTINLDAIPSNFVPVKPISDCPDSVLTSATTIAQKKHDGHCVFLVKGTSGQARIFSRRMEDYTPQCSALPFIVSQLAHLDNGDFVLTEVTFFDTKLGKEIAKVVGSVIRDKDPANAVRKYAHLSETGAFACRPFDILFRKGVFVGAKDFKDRWALLRSMELENIPEILEWKGPDSGLVSRAREEKWEGFVLRTPGPKSTIGYTMDGKAHRKGSYKYKFTKTGDFVVTEALRGDSGKHSHFVSKFHIIEYEESGKTLIPVERGYVGPGTLSHDELEQLTKDLKSGKRTIPFVVEIEYQSLHDDTGKLQFGIIQRIRDDKVPSECITEE